MLLAIVGRPLATHSLTVRFCVRAKEREITTEKFHQRLKAASNNGEYLLRG